MIRFRLALLTTALATVPAIASATTITGPYVDVGGGYNLVQTQHVHAGPNPASPNEAFHKFSLDHNTGFTGFGSFGWGLATGFVLKLKGFIISRM